MREKSQQEENGQRAIDEHFDSLASKYNTTTEWRQDQKIISWFQRSLRDRSRCLDLATGTGIIAAELEKIPIPFVVGVDRSWKMLQAARLILGNTVSGDALLLPFSAASFDAIAVRQLFHYVDDLSCLNEISRVTMTSGVLACAHVTAPDEDLAQWWRKIKKIVQPLRQRFYTTNELEFLVEEGGFKIERVSTIKITRRDPWEKFFVNCRNDNDIFAIREMIDNTPKDITRKLGLQISPNGLAYNQYWTLILGRHSQVTKS